MKSICMSVHANAFLGYFLKLEENFLKWYQIWPFLTRITSFKWPIKPSRDARRWLCNILSLYQRRACLRWSTLWYIFYLKLNRPTYWYPQILVTIVSWKLWKNLSWLMSCSGQPEVQIVRWLLRQIGMLFLFGHNIFWLLWVKLFIVLFEYVKLTYAADLGNL